MRIKVERLGSAGDRMEIGLRQLLMDKFDVSDDRVMSCTHADPISKSHSTRPNSRPINGSWSRSKSASCKEVRQSKVSYTARSAL